MCMFSYATARESTPNIKVNRSKSRNVYMKIISATQKTIKIKIFNKINKKNCIYFSYSIDN